MQNGLDKSQTVSVQFRVRYVRKLQLTLHARVQKISKKMQERLEKSYLPAAGHDVFLPLYDAITKLSGMDHARNALLRHVELKPGDRVLDIGCGTGSFLVEINRRCAGIETIGLDSDAKALMRAQRKGQRAGVQVQFDLGFSDALSYPDQHFNWVFSTFMFHHLPPEEKEKTLREIHRVLKPSGRLLLVDFEVSELNGRSLLSRLFRAHAFMEQNSADRICALLFAAGFSDVRKIDERMALFGLARAGYYRASF